MSNRSDQKARTRSQLIDAALILLSQNRSFGELGLREVAREAGIAPNSFYRHFFDMDDLGLALVDVAGQGLRQFIRDARSQITDNPNAVKITVDAFFEHINSNTRLFHMLLRERGGSESYRRAIRNEINYAINELSEMLEWYIHATNKPLYDHHLAAEAIVTVAFGLGGDALDADIEGRDAVAERMLQEINMILIGAEVLAQIKAEKKR